MAGGELLQFALELPSDAGTDAAPPVDGRIARARGHGFATDRVTFGVEEARGGA